MMHAIIKDGQILIYDSYIFKESIKEIPGRQWHPEEKAWSVPISQQNIETLDLLGCELSDELANIRQEFASENTTDENTLLPAPLKVSPYEHQLKGYNLACRSMGIIGGNGVSPGFALLMEMGTGKTITSIAIVGKAYLTGKIKRLLILAPKSIVAVWGGRVCKVCGFPVFAFGVDGNFGKKGGAVKNHTT